MIFQMFCNVFFFLYMALERLSTFLKGRGMWLTKSLLLFQIMNQNILPLPLTLKEYQGVLIVFVQVTFGKAHLQVLYPDLQPFFL